MAVHTDIQNGTVKIPVKKNNKKQNILSEDFICKIWLKKMTVTRDIK